MIKLSVITPIYNTEKFLEKNLAGLVAQHMEGIEFIWIDNGSSPYSRDIIRKYKQKRNNIHVISLEHNIGYGGAMNKGLEIAKGEYIGFCDSDDWVEPDYFERLYAIANNTNADVVYTTYTLEYANKPPKHCGHMTGISIAKSLCDKFDALRNGAVWDKIYKRSLIEDNKVRFPSDMYSLYQDNLFLVPSIMHASSVVLADEPVYHYRQSDTSTTQNKNERHGRNEHFAELLGALLNFSTKNNLTTQEKQHYVDFLFRSLPLGNIVKHDGSICKKIKATIPYDYFFTVKLDSLFYIHHPPLIQRMFSIKYGEQGKILRIAGFKISLRRVQVKYHESFNFSWRSWYTSRRRNKYPSQADGGNRR